MTTLVVEEWCKSTPLDTTTSKVTLYNNINGDGKVEGLVVLFTWWRLICILFFEIFEGGVM